MNKGKIRFPRYEIPGLVERPAWWLVRPEEIVAAVKGVRRGEVVQIATTPGGWPVHAGGVGPAARERGHWHVASASSSRNVGAYKTGEGARRWSSWCAASRRGAGGHRRRA